MNCNMPQSLNSNCYNNALLMTLSTNYYNDNRYSVEINLQGLVWNGHLKEVLT